MTIEIKDKRIARAIMDEAARGVYSSVEEMLGAAVETLRHSCHPSVASHDSSRIQKLIDEGEASGECMSADEFFAKMDQHIAVAKFSRRTK